MKDGLDRTSMKNIHLAKFHTLNVTLDALPVSAPLA